MNRIFLSLIIIFVALTSFSQNDSIDFDKFKEDYNKFIQQEKEAFQRYKEDRDKEFADFLKADWENYQLFIENKPIVIPGPDKIPNYNSALNVSSSKKLNPKKINEVKPTIVDESSYQLKPIPAIITADNKKNYDVVNLDYYGNSLNFIYHKKLKDAKINAVSESQIANFWADACKTDYYNTIEQMLEYKNLNNLNDFAYMKLAEKISEQIHSNNKNNSKLLTWFLLAKSGYKLKVGYSGNSVYILVPCVNVIYSYSYFVLENLKYYIFEEETQVKSIYTYRQDYPEANKIMNFNIYKAPLLGPEKYIRELDFTYENKSYKFDIAYSKNLIEFYDDYPQGEIQIFFNAGVSSFVKESLDLNIEPAIAEMTETEAANFLLNFVQTAFDYQTDQEQFGYEKFFFPEEIFHYKYCDCEDRSVFYAYLVNEYLRLPVAGLNYPGHMATAVRFTETVNGSYYLLDNERFVVCDPTYINAPIGACMPNYLKSEVTILRLKNSQVVNSATNTIWQQLAQNGYIRTNYENDIIKTDDNTWYVTGLVDSSTNFAGLKPKILGDEEKLFFAKLDNKGNILFLETIFGDGLLMPIGIAHSQYGIYISGYFSKNIKAGDQQLEATYDKELFMACYDHDHNLQWLRASGIVNEVETSNMFFAVNMDKKGNFIKTESISAESFENQKAIDLSNPDNITLFVKFDMPSPGLKDSELYNNPSSFEFATNFKDFTNNLLSQNYNKNTAPLLAFLKILQNGDISVTGIEILAAALSMNHDFKALAPQLFNSLKEIENISSKNGIINLNLKNPENFVLGNLHFEKNSQFRVVNYKSGNIEIIVTKGISYKPHFKNYVVNFIKIFKASDDINIDYDFDNDKKNLNIEKHLLK